MTRATLCLTPILLLALAGCRREDVVEASLPPCASLARVDTAGWVEVRQPELTFRVPPAYAAPQRDTGEYSISISLVAPERDLYVEYGSTAAPLTYTKKQIIRRQHRPSCAATLGGRRARVAVWASPGDLWRHPPPERGMNYGAGAYWPPVRGDSGLVLAVRLRDSSHIEESLTILGTVRLTGARGP